MPHGLRSAHHLPVRALGLALLWGLSECVALARSRWSGRARSNG